MYSKLISACFIDQVKLQLHDAIYRLRFYSKLLIHILSLSNLDNNIAPIQKNRGDKSHHVIVAQVLLSPTIICNLQGDKLHLKLKSLSISQKVCKIFKPENLSNSDKMFTRSIVIIIIFPH